MDEKLPITVTVSPEPLPETWTINDTFELARDLAIDHTKEAFAILLKRAGLTEGQFATLQEQPTFRGMLLSQLKEWLAVGNSEQRIRLRARLGLEAALLPISKRLADKTEPLVSVASMAKVLADVGALSKPEPSAHAPGERITITLDFGADTRLTFEKTPGAPSPLSEDGEGARDITPVQPIPEKA